MISVPNSNPKTVSFEQKVSNNTAEIAKSQLGKLALAETHARAEKENADFRLAKATDSLRTSEIAYREAVQKSSWNREALRTAYNNAIAEYRSADASAIAKAEALSLATGALEGTRAVASGEILKREFSDEKRQDLAAKGKAMPDGSFPIENRGDLANAIQSVGRAKDYDATKKHIITQAKELGAEADLPEDWKEGKSLSTAVPATKSLRKDASMPTDQNGYTYAADFGAPLGDMTDAQFDAQYDAVLCPDCLGFDGNEGCPQCGGVNFIAIAKSVSTNPFSTDELLTRPFQKSEAYQNYIMKGGPGSGPQPGHEFEGNQYTGGMRTFTRGEMAGKREGWKQTIARYQGAHDQHMANGRKAVAESKALEKAGRFRDAADKMEEAAGHFQKAHGALKGQQMVHQRETLNGSFGASQSKVAEAANAASALKADSGEWGTAVNEVGRLSNAANAAESAAYASSGQ
jgi:hypothetical protein